MVVNPCPAPYSHLYRGGLTHPTLLAILERIVGRTELRTHRLLFSGARRNESPLAPSQIPEAKSQVCSGTLRAIPGDVAAVVNKVRTHGIDEQPVLRAMESKWFAIVR